MYKGVSLANYVKEDKETGQDLPKKPNSIMKIDHIFRKMTFSEKMEAKFQLYMQFYETLSFSAITITHKTSFRFHIPHKVFS